MTVLLLDRPGAEGFEREARNLCQREDDLRRRLTGVQRRKREALDVWARTVSPFQRLDVVRRHGRQGRWRVEQVKGRLCPDLDVDEGGRLVVSLELRRVKRDGELGKQRRSSYVGNVEAAEGGAC